MPQVRATQDGVVGPDREFDQGRSGAASPYKWASLSLVLDAFACLCVIVYLLYRPIDDPDSIYFVFSCPHCNQRLRFRTLPGRVGVVSEVQAAGPFPR